MSTSNQPAPLGFVTVDIYDQRYHLSGQEAEQIRRLAEMVDSRMRAVSAQGRTVDSLRVAVLAALNLADELDRSRKSVKSVSVDHDRMVRMQQLLDQLLNEERRAS